MLTSHLSSSPTGNVRSVSLVCPFGALFPRWTAMFQCYVYMLVLFGTVEAGLWYIKPKIAMRMNFLFQCCAGKWRHCSEWRWCSKWRRCSRSLYFAV